MKTKVLIFALLLVSWVTTFAQVDSTLKDVRMNLSIGNFTTGGSGDFTGPVGVVGSTGYTVDDLAVGDVFIDDLHNRYRIDVITIVVAGSVATLEVTCFDDPCIAPQTGKGFAFKPTSNLGLQLFVENGSNFITEELEAKALTHNFLALDQAISEIDPKEKIGVAEIAFGAGDSTITSNANFTKTVIGPQRDLIEINQGLMDNLGATKEGTFRVAEEDVYYTANLEHTSDGLIIKGLVDTTLTGQAASKLRFYSGTKSNGAVGETRVGQGMGDITWREFGANKAEAVSIEAVYQGTNAAGKATADLRFLTRDVNGNSGSNGVGNPIMSLTAEHQVQFNDKTASVDDAVSTPLTSVYYPSAEGYLQVAPIDSLKSVLGDEVDDADADPTNEYVSSFSLANDTLSLIDGSGEKEVDLKPYAQNVYNTDGALTGNRSINAGSFSWLVESAGNIGRFSLDGSGNTNLYGLNLNLEANNLYWNPGSNVTSGNANSDQIVVRNPVSGSLRTLNAGTFSTGNIYTQNGTILNNRNVQIDPAASLQFFHPLAGGLVLNNQGFAVNAGIQINSNAFTWATTLYNSADLEKSQIVMLDTTNNQMQLSSLSSFVAESSDQRYDAGNGVYVTATGAGVTTTKVTGQITITVPSDVTLHSFRVVGSAGDLNSGELQIIIAGGKGAGVDFNTTDADLYHPDITVQNRTAILPTDPYLQRPDDAGDSITIFDERFSASGQVSVKITGISGDFGIKGSM